VKEDLEKAATLYQHQGSFSKAQKIESIVKGLDTLFDAMDIRVGN
jgi:hypothetical protein